MKNIPSILFFLFPSSAFAYTPFITAGFFDGVTTDVTAACAGVLTLSVIILGAGLLIRFFFNR